MKTKYRIVRDAYAGYEVRVWRWWMPIWIQAGFVNTHLTIAQAEEYAKQHARGCVKYLGEL